jgi:tetratricopeptide (TPR) repeat protein
VPLGWILATLLMAVLAADADFVAGKQLYDSFEYEQALFRFEQVLVKPGLQPAEKAEVSLWLAVCLEGVGRVADADRAMQDAARLDPAASLPVATAPAFQTRWRDIVAAARAAPATTTTVTTTTPAPAVTTTTAAPSTLGLAVGAGGGVALLGAAVLGAVSAERWVAATDTAAFVDERVVAHGGYVAALTGAVVSGVVGAGLLVTAVVLPSSPTEAP